MATVLGHYTAAGSLGLGKPVFGWSQPLFNAVAQDDLSTLEKLLQDDFSAGEWALN
jgi:hypothetical protein